MKYHAVIFDLGGTLIDQSTWGDQADYVGQMADALGVAREEFLRVWRDTYAERTTGALGSVEDGIRYICRHLNAPVDEGRIAIAANIPFEITKRWVMAPNKDAVPVLQDIKSRGLKTGLLSNWSSHLPLVWKESPLEPVIDAAVFSCSVGLMKPDPSFFVLAAERLRVAPPACLYVADGMDGELSAASGVGMTAVMIRYPNVADENPYREEWGGAVISSLREVLDLVK